MYTPSERRLEMTQNGSDVPNQPRLLARPTALSVSVSVPRSGDVASSHIAVSMAPALEPSPARTSDWPW